VIVYAPIRQHPDGDEWIQEMHVASIKSWVEHLLTMDAKHTPDWDRKYPLVRISRFRCTEIKGDKS